VSIENTFLSEKYQSVMSQSVYILPVTQASQLPRRSRHHFACLIIWSRFVFWAVEAKSVFYGILEVHKL